MTRKSGISKAALKRLAELQNTAIADQTDWASRTESALAHPESEDRAHSVEDVAGTLDSVQHWNARDLGDLSGLSEDDIRNALY